MATERLLMRHIREILRLKWTLRRSHRDTARSLGISAGAVASVVTRAKAKALTWEGIGTLSDDALERTLYGPKLALTVVRPGPDLVWMHTELRRAGVTLELVHLEYLATHPDGYRYWRSAGTTGAGWRSSAPRCARSTRRARRRLSTARTRSPTPPTAIIVLRKELESRTKTTASYLDHYHWRTNTGNLSRSSASLRSDHDAVVPVITMAWTD
jgi:hypothetical protein